jgi:hypothetical protein
MIMPGRTELLRSPDHVLPPSRLAKKPPFSVPTYTHFELACATSMAVTTVLSKFAETAFHVAPSSVVFQTRVDAV